MTADTERTASAELRQAAETLRQWVVADLLPGRWMVAVDWLGWESDFDAEHMDDGVLAAARWLNGGTS